MPITFYAPEWGNTLPFADFCLNVKTAGYDGIEMALPLDPQASRETVAVLRHHDLALIGQYWQSFETDLNEHCRNYEKYLRHLITAEPVLVNCQTGKDFFTVDQNRQLFELAARISAETGVKIIHETHRGKSLFAAHICQNYLTLFPDIRLCLDISHWCTVHESLLENQSEAVNLAISHTDHIHSRVGFAEGPQVNDPRAPEWEPTLNIYLNWWDQVVAHHQKAGTQLTVNTEFGPPPYLPVLPHSQEPVASQWDINVYILNLLKQRYA